MKNAKLPAKLLIISLGASSCAMLEQRPKRKLVIPACVADVASGGAQCSLGVKDKDDDFFMPWINMDNYLCFPPSDVEALLEVIGK